MTISHLQSTIKPFALVAEFIIFGFNNSMPQKKQALNKNDKVLTHN